MENFKSYGIINLGEWVPMKPSKELPSDCHIGGNEETASYRGSLHIGRKQFGNEVVIGKVIDSWKSGYCEIITM